MTYYSQLSFDNVQVCRGPHIFNIVVLSPTSSKNIDWAPWCTVVESIVSETDTRIQKNVSSTAANVILAIRDICYICYICCVSYICYICYVYSY